MEPGGPYRFSAKRRAARRPGLKGSVVLAGTVLFAALTIGTILLFAEVLAR
ncbi:MAG: hypothetical protein U0269_26175 [Polyangiales bacterium]